MADSANGKFRLKKPSATFLVCLCAAVVIWGVGRFAKYYTMTMSFAVTLTDMPQKYPHTTLSDSVFVLKFRARGFDFLKSDFSEANRKLELPVNRLILAKKSNLYNYSFSKNELEDFLKNEGFYENEFLEVESPEHLRIYLKK